MLRPNSERMRVLHAQAKRPKPEPIADAEVTGLVYALARQVDELRAQVRDLRDKSAARDDALLQIVDRQALMLTDMLAQIRMLSETLTPLTDKLRH